MPSQQACSLSPQLLSAQQNPALATGVILPEPARSDSERKYCRLMGSFLFNFTKLSIHALGSNVNHTLLFVSERQKQIFYFIPFFL